MTASIAATPAAEAPSARKSPLCPECGAAFARKSYQQTFCCAAHKTAFQARAAAEGRAIIALAKAWRYSRNAAENRELGAKCLSELSGILDLFNSQDRAAGRPSPMLYAETLLRDARGRFIDRQRRA